MQTTRTIESVSTKQQRSNEKVTRSGVATRKIVEMNQKEGRRRSERVRGVREKEEDAINDLL